jgi:hypothetical protein
MTSEVGNQYSGLWKRIAKAVVLIGSTDGICTYRKFIAPDGGRKPIRGRVFNASVVINGAIFVPLNNISFCKSLRGIDALGFSRKREKSSQKISLRSSVWAVLVGFYRSPWRRKSQTLSDNEQLVLSSVDHPNIQREKLRNLNRTRVKFRQH